MGDTHQQERHDAGALGFRVDHQLADPLEDVDLDFRRLEHAIDHVEGAFQHGRNQAPTGRALLQQRYETAERQRWRVVALEQQRQVFAALGNEVPIGIGILLRELGDARAGLVQILVGLQTGAVVEYG
ncbi:hypothetical protein D9M68_966190 [compost metagenome]